MTDLVPVAANTALTPVNGLQNALLVTDDMRGALAEAGDTEQLLLGLEYLKTIKRDLDTLIRATEDDIVRLMEDKKQTFDGIGVVEKKTAVTRKWDSEGLMKHLVRTSLDPEGTGEITLDSVFHLIESLKMALPLTGSLGWRVTELAKMGIDTDQFCDKTFGRTSLTITK